MMLLKSFFQRIIKDFRHKELVPLKLVFFVQASTLYVLYPYLTIHMRELGINVEETAIMSAVTPFVAIIMPPLAGLLADRIGNFKILLSVFSSLGGAAALLLLLVPIGRVTVKFPDRVVMNVQCPGNSGQMIYAMHQAHPCHPSLQPEISTRIESCGYICRANVQNTTDLQELLSSRRYTVKHFNLITGQNYSFKYLLSKNDLPKDFGQVDMRENRKLFNNEFFKTSIRRISESSYFFPTNQIYEFVCQTDTNSSIEEKKTWCSFGPLLVSSLKEKGRTINYQAYRSKLNILPITEDDSREDRRRFSVEKAAWKDANFEQVFCDNPDNGEDKVFFHVPRSHESEDESFEVDSCRKSCILTAPRKDICSNDNMEIEYNISLTFWLYLLIRVFIGMIGGTAFAMLEGAVIAILREQKADYGLQRIYGSIGGMISSPLSGLLIDYASSGKGYTDFRPAFYLYAALKIVSGFFMLWINLEFKAPASNVVSDVLFVLKKFEMIALFIVCFILGTAWGYIESFLYWLIQDLGGSRSLMGITITVGGIAGIPLLVLSGPIIDRIGHANVLFIGFIFYAIRLLGYSLIYNPWLVLIFEALESVTSSLSFTAAVTYAAKLSTVSTDSSVQGLLGGLYYGVGRGTGSLIGGFLMKAFGTRPTYQIFAALTLLTGLIYFCFNMLFLRKRSQANKDDLEEEKKMKSAAKENSLEKGIIEIALEDKKSSMGKEDVEGSRDAQKFRSKDFEALNNAKNLENIEALSDDDGRDGRDGREIGNDNPAFEDGESKENENDRRSVVKSVKSVKRQTTNDKK